ncbi:hypothetical protein [Streptomyces sp. 135]|uniref:hypothetical protein n=1 Tax=Streptomyces sp. 135 TaxID=2838850 RepID=UPI001CBE26F7|nr:hypothetical protein [Streptomyces sp. 135]
MALAPLATVADLEARGVTIELDELTAVTAYLDVASTLVRQAAGSPVSETTSTVVLEGGPSPWLCLPGLPVRSVSAVTVDGLADSRWTLVPSGALYRSCGWFSVADLTLVEVTYVHGLPEVPADIVDMVCRMVGQELLSFRSGEGVSRVLKTERIGDYSAGYDTDLETGTLALTRFQRDRLAARFGGGVGSVRAR